MRASLQPFPRSQSPWEVLTDLSVVGIATAEFDGGWVDVLSDPAGVVAHHGTTFVHLFGELARQLDVHGVEIARAEEPGGARAVRARAFRAVGGG